MSGNDCNGARAAISGCKERCSSPWNWSTTEASGLRGWSSSVLGDFQKNLYHSVRLLSHHKNSNWSWDNLWRKAVDTCPISATTDIFVPCPALVFFTILEDAMDPSALLQMQTLFNPVIQIKCFLCFSLFWGFSVCWKGDTELGKVHFKCSG